VSARLGGGLNYVLDDDWALDGTLDYRYRTMTTPTAAMTRTCAGTRL